MRYRLHDCTVAPEGHTILSHVDFEIRSGEKVAVVGLNGAGKTTLLRLLAGRIEPDRDDRREGEAIERSEAFTTGYLEQVREEDEDSERLSGGQKTRRALAELLETSPDLLLLDEPTNHLDLESTERLERVIRSYKGAVVIVSHDRYFLDRTADSVYELKDGKLTRYGGNYTAYRETRDMNEAAARRRYRKYAEEAERLTELIERFRIRPNKAAMARAKRKQLERLKAEMGEEPPRERPYYMKEIVPETPGPKLLWEADKLECGYEGRKLFEITMKLTRGHKVGILGRNGCGKSTLLKTMTGQLPPLGGRQELSEYASVGCFDQDTVRTDTTMSGGEQAKLRLREIAEAAPNLMLLDEPTNHMDIPSRETIEEMLVNYKGTIVFVSHDRYFLSRVADSLLIFDKGEVSFYPFGYDHYLYRKEHGNGTVTADSIMEAQAAAMLEEYEKVPEREKGMLRTLSTAELERDWRLGLALERCREAEQKAETAADEYYFGSGTAEILNTAWDAWTESLIEWYDIYVYEEND